MDSSYDDQKLTGRGEGGWASISIFYVPDPLPTRAYF